MKSKTSIFPRNCPVCLGQDKTMVFRQEFSSFSEGSLMNGYDLTVCRSCGAGFADNIPAQTVFDSYYAAMSKYERSEMGGQLSEGSAKFYAEIADAIVPYVTNTESITDIGCATGGLLAEFKRRGFDNLQGMDPSSACCSVAKRLFEINVIPMTISRLNEVTERFDVVMLTGVLEHLRDVEESLNALIKLLKPGGRLVIVVPDASKYQESFSAPFQFFSMEHVNYFAPISLTNLMLRHGLQEMSIQRTVGYLGPNSCEPVLIGIFKRYETNKNLTGLKRDTETEPALRLYIKKSRLQEEQIEFLVDESVKSQCPLLVWGTGTHTLRLLEIGNLSKANILAFIDSNPNYQGKKLHGIPIIAPSEWDDPSATILISSQVAESEIKNHILNVLQWENPIICLYSGNEGKIEK
jgi:SAM-dependent methyltransferase